MIIDSSMIISGFVSKVVNDYVDKKKDADKDKKSNRQSKETRVYQVTIDALNEFTKNKYNDQEILYDAAESILKGFQSSQYDKVEAVRNGLKILVTQVTSDVCESFLDMLCHEICKDKNSELYKEIEMAWQEQINGNIQNGFKENNRNHKETHEKLDNFKEDIDYIKENIYTRENRRVQSAGGILTRNRAEEYAEKWNRNVFLNNYNKRDKNAGVNIKLKDLYLDEHLPHYIWGKNDTEDVDIKELLKEYIVDMDDKKMLLILGQPGIGKSTLITWIMANFPEKKSDICVYQFASDLKDIDWRRDDILKAIFERLNLKYDELEEKVLILDGFDEIHANNDRERILNQIYQELNKISFLKQFSLIITCRKNYIQKLWEIKCDYITLQVWDEEQIKSFCKTYANISNCLMSRDTINKLVENKEILGTPLILYIVLALGISIEENNSLVDIYDQVFSLEGGGIYDRCINNLSYDKEHRISKIKEQIHQISQRIAFWIFENNSEKAFIPQTEYERICNTAINERKGKNEDVRKDIFIGSYFEIIKHCEGIGTNEVHFVHRSIYEYFIAVYFFESIHRLTSKNEIAGKLGELLKQGRLSDQILVFIKYKFDRMGKYDLANISKDIFNIMLQDGMTYHTGMVYKNVIYRERMIFFNMLEIVHLWNAKLEKVNKKIRLYVHCGYWRKLNLSGIDLSNVDLYRVYLYEAILRRTDLSEVNLCDAVLHCADLREANLSKGKLNNADLSGADLSGANLSKANLYCTDLSEANLSGANLNMAVLDFACLYKANLNGANLSNADLSRASIKETDLSKANLFGTIFDEKQVKYLQKKYDLSNSKVDVLGTNEIISYEEYCNRKQQMKNFMKK